MIWYEIAAVTLFVVTAIVSVVWLLGGRRQWGTALLIFLGMVLGTLLFASRLLPRPVEVVLILDQALREEDRADVERLLTRLAETGAERFALLVVEPSSEPRPDLTWVKGSVDLCARLHASAASQTTVSAAIDTAVHHLQPKGVWTQCLAVARGSAGRVILGVTDQRRWKTWDTFDVEERLEQVRETDVVIDRIELHPRPMAPVIDIRAPLGLLADWDLAGYPLSVEVTVRTPRFTSLQKQAVTGFISGRLDLGSAELANYAVNAKVLETSEVVFDVPVSQFKPAAGSPLKLGEGLVRCELRVELTIAGEKFRGLGVAYLPVRQSRAWIVAGCGDGAPRLLPPAPDEVERLRSHGNVLFTARRSKQAARFECVTPKVFQAALDSGEQLPSLIVLHEPSRDFWTEANIDRLDQAVQHGLQLVVVDPPPLPNTLLAKKLARLLPAVSQTDERSATPLPRTADRKPILNLVFDPGTWGAVRETPGVKGAPGQRAAIPDALEDVQLKAAQKVIETYRNRGWLKNSLQYDKAWRRVTYAPHPDDQILVRVAPTLQAVDALTRKVFGSALEFRLAAHFAQDLPEMIKATGNLASFGLQPAPKATGQYPLGDPGFTPNQALIVFTGNVPQPIPGALNEPIFFQVDGGSERTAQSMPTHLLARLLLRGVVTAVIRIDAPEYEVGLSELATHWPKAGKNPLQSFKADPKIVLETTLAGMPKLHAGFASWLTPDEAKARLLKAPFYGVLNLEDSQVHSKSLKLGATLAEELAPLFGSPRDSMVLAVTEHGRFIDERIGPGLPLTQLTALSAPGGKLDTIWKKPSRWTAPRRLRRLEPTDFPDASRAIYLAALDTGIEAARVKPWPLAYGGQRGEGSVFCLGYSPFELAEKWVTQTEDRICDENADDGLADAHGPQRLIDIATFAGRLRTEPRELPLIHQVALVDARGGVDVSVQFRTAHTADSKFWEPRLVVNGSSPRRDILLTLQSVNGAARVAVFRAEATAIRQACGEDQGIEVVLETNGQLDPKSRFTLAKPAGEDWLFSPVLEAVTSLAQFSGGTVGAADALQPLQRPMRVPLLLGLLLAALALVVDRGRWRWLLWLGASVARLARIRGERNRLSAVGLAEERGGGQTPPLGSAQGQMDHQSPLRSGDKLEHVRKKVLAQFLLGIRPIPIVDRRILARSIRLDLVVHVGASMRACCDRGGEHFQVRFAGFVAQLLAELYWSAGAMVRLIATGIEGGPQIYGPYPTRGGDNGLEEILQSLTKVPATAPDFPRRFTVEPGTTVIWISDFLTEPDLPQLLSWGAGLADDDGRFAAVHLHIPEEDELVGFGFVASPGALLDRSALTPVDLAQAAKAHVQDLQRRFARAGLAFASLQGDMTGPTLVETLEEAGILGSRS